MRRFLHIADLHHARHTSNAITAERSSFDVQREKLQQLNDIIRSESVQAVFVAGDIEVSDADDFLPYLIEWTALGAAVYIVFGEHDVNRLEYKASWENVPGVHCFLEPGYVVDFRLGLGIYGLSCDSNQVGLPHQLEQIPTLPTSRPNILLSHGNRRHFSTERLARHNFQYVALGDDHRNKVIHRNHIPLVYPGHLFSVWDGSGKAWPTGYVLGTVEKDHITHTFYPYAGPETRRVCVNPFVRQDRNIQLILDNIDWDGERWIEDDAAVVRSFLRTILRDYPDDYFVTPSNKAYSPRRLCMTGQTLLDSPDCFDDFVNRSYKATPRTQ